MKRRLFLMTAAAAIGSTGLLGAGCTTTGPDEPRGPTAKREDIQSGADEALARLYRNAPESKALAERASGILIFPRLYSGGFVVGGEYGDGILRTRGRDAGFYRMIGGSLGWQAGAQSQAVIFMFMTPEALDAFRNSNGWTAGVDATVSVVHVGATGGIDTNTAKQSVVGFALTNVGLYAGAKLDGVKITRLAL
jgi:lipid-binding SYLF domain-containing protein